MKKYMLGLSLISSFCFANIAFNTKITLIDSEQQIEKDMLFTAELDKQSEVIVDDFKIIFLVKSVGEKYRGEFEIYRLGKLISKPVLLFAKDVPGTIKLEGRRGDGLEKQFTFSISIAN